MKYYIIDAFADQQFRGNPAGVCLVEEPLTPNAMQNIAFENNLSETAFVKKGEAGYSLRWFTPETEIDLCGHATLASAFVLMNYVDTTMGVVEFQTKSGRISVERQGELYHLNFPSRKPTPCPIPHGLKEALNANILETHQSRDLLILVEDELTVQNLQVDFSKLKEFETSFAFIVTAKGQSCDFVSRFFAPGAGIAEDPVTGSAHCTLIPFWSQRLSKKEMMAKQLSRRGGVLCCEDLGERVRIGGRAVRYLEGEIFL